jgi:hypothetical protein
MYTRLQVHEDAMLCIKGTVGGGYAYRKVIAWQLVHDALIQLWYALRIVP